MGIESLAMTYSELGRHTDALPLFEKALHTKQRHLSADHPAICEQTACPFLLISKILLYCFSHDHELSCSGILLLWEVHGCAGIARKGVGGPTADIACGSCRYW